ncbi:unnamed protein product [Cuscuta campestris]|uniref:Uncharacterized protein n=1 Tax=Cuscuta campestris TaxID=132261 RepID=A0A484MTD8_9ASTE|nr:unnamed protein product [Cuscuta campestris]
MRYSLPFNFLYFTEYCLFPFQPAEISLYKLEPSKPSNLNRNFLPKLTRCRTIGCTRLLNFNDRVPSVTTTPEIQDALAKQAQIAVGAARLAQIPVAEARPKQTEEEEQTAHVEAAETEQAEDAAAQGIAAAAAAPGIGAAAAPAMLILRSVDCNFNF